MGKRHAWILPNEILSHGAQTPSAFKSPTTLTQTYCRLVSEMLQHQHTKQSCSQPEQNELETVLQSHQMLPKAAHPTKSLSVGHKRLVLSLPFSPESAGTKLWFKTTNNTISPEREREVLWREREGVECCLFQRGWGGVFDFLIQRSLLSIHVHTASDFYNNLWVKRWRVFLCDKALKLSVIWQHFCFKLMTFLNNTKHFSSFKKIQVHPKPNISVEAIKHWTMLPDHLSQSSLYWQRRGNAMFAYGG